MREDTIVEQRTRLGRLFTKTSTSRQNSVRCGVPYSRLRAAAVRRDGRRRREGGPRVPRSSHTCRRGRVVRRKRQRSSWRDTGTVRRHDAVDVATETSRAGHRGPETRGSPLGGDDREMSAFYATQIDADVDASTAHIIGDIIARHVTNQSVGDRIAPAANELCGQLELIAMTSRNAVSGNRRLAEKRTANAWTDTDAGGGDCGGLFR